MNFKNFLLQKSASPSNFLSAFGLLSISFLITTTFRHARVLGTLLSQTPDLEALRHEA